MSPISLVLCATCSIILKGRLVLYDTYHMQENDGELSPKLLTFADGISLLEGLTMLFVKMPIAEEMIATVW